ncbi:MAG TPA: type II toxin-antitoxin system HicA family toxin [Rhodothermales bacterium]|nr:type II toxin-antitoxin system HicA family toxin [Rhodothermales bacterium]
MKRRITVREAIKMIENDGWYLARTKGSHRQYKHPSKFGTVTIAGDPNHVLHPKTLGSIIRQAQLRKQ